MIPLRRSSRVSSGGSTAAAPPPLKKARLDSGKSCDLKSVTEVQVTSSPPKVSKNKEQKVRLSDQKQPVVAAALSQSSPTVPADQLEDDKTANSDPASGVEKPTVATKVVEIFPDAASPFKRKKGKKQKKRKRARSSESNGETEIENKAQKVLVFEPAAVTETLILSEPEAPSEPEATNLSEPHSPLNQKQNKDLQQKILSSFDDADFAPFLDLLLPCPKNPDISPETSSEVLELNLPVPTDPVVVNGLDGSRVADQPMIIQYSDEIAAIPHITLPSSPVCNFNVEVISVLNEDSVAELLKESGLVLANQEEELTKTCDQQESKEDASTEAVVSSRRLRSNPPVSSPITSAINKPQNLKIASLVLASGSGIEKQSNGIGKHAPDCWFTNEIFSCRSDSLLTLEKLKEVLEEDHKRNKPRSGSKTPADIVSTPVVQEYLTEQSILLESMRLAFIARCKCLPDEVKTSLMLQERSKQKSKKTKKKSHKHRRNKHEKKSIVGVLTSEAEVDKQVFQVETPVEQTSVKDISGPCLSEDEVEDTCSKPKQNNSTSLNLLGLVGYSDSESDLEEKIQLAEAETEAVSTEEITANGMDTATKCNEYDRSSENVQVPTFFSVPGNLPLSNTESEVSKLSKIESMETQQNEVENLISNGQRSLVYDLALSQSSDDENDDLSDSRGQSSFPDPDVKVDDWKMRNQPDKKATVDCNVFESDEKVLVAYDSESQHSMMDIDIDSNRTEIKEQGTSKVSKEFMDTAESQVDMSYDRSSSPVAVNKMPECEESEDSSTDESDDNEVAVSPPANIVKELKGPDPDSESEVDPYDDTALDYGE